MAEGTRQSQAKQPLKQLRNEDLLFNPQLAWRNKGGCAAVHLHNKVAPLQRLLILVVRHLALGLLVQT